MQFGMLILIENKTLADNIAMCRGLGLSFVELNMNFPDYQVDKLEWTDLLAKMGAFGMFIALAFALFMNVGMAGTLEPGILMAVTAAGWPLVTLGLCIGGLVWYVRKEG